MKKLFIIFNPQAGRGRAAGRRTELERALQSLGLPFELYLTHTPDAASHLARQAIEQGYERLVVVGGDGTLNQVSNAMMNNQAGDNIALGLVPVGTGNDFIKSLENLRANDIGGAVAHLASSSTRQIDIGQVQLVRAGTQQPITRYFLNNLALGIDAVVAANAQQVPLLTGLPAYLAGAAQALSSYRIHPMTVRFNGSELRQGLLLATVANGRCQGGGFWLTPSAQLDDGLLDLCLVERLPAYQIVPYMLRALRGTHTGLARVHIAQARRITVEYSAPTLVITDGEVIATDAQHLEVAVLPCALQILA